MTALRRDEIEFELESGTSAPSGARTGPATCSRRPAAPLHWQRLLRGDLALGQVLAGEMGVAGEPLARARVRGQVVAVGPQSVAERRFDVAVIELFGDAQHGEACTRLDGAIVVDRASGVLLRLDLRSAQPAFTLQRRLVRIEPRHAERPRWRHRSLPARTWRRYGRRAQSSFIVNPPRRS